MVEAATKLPIKTEAKAPAVAAHGWAPFDALRREMDRLFEQFGFHGGAQPLSRSLPSFELSWPREPAWSLAPAVDVKEKPTQYEISAELPGIAPADVEVKLSNGMLTIKGEKKEEQEQREADSYVSERRYGSFVRSFSVPDGVDAAKIEAQFANGVLTVLLPKSAEAQAQEQKIPVKAA